MAQSNVGSLAGGEANAAVMEALAADKREGLLLATRARWVALAVIAVFLPFLNTTWSVLYYEFLLLGFALTGWAQLKIGRVGRSRAELFLMGCELALLTFIVVVPNPFSVVTWPTAMQYRFENFLYFFILLAGATMAYSWRTVLAMGTWTTGLWLGAMVLVLLFGVEQAELSAAAETAFAGHPFLIALLDPNAVDIGLRFQEIVVFLITAGVLALGGWRANRLLHRQAEVARQRANLARHFAPTMVDQLATRDQPLGDVRAQPVAVLFADIVGFTKLAERQSPEEVVATLREFHSLMERAVFDNGGTLDKFLGDGLMVTFGTPDEGPEDADNGLRCARAMHTSVAAWNGDRRARGAEPIRLSVGMHYGEVVLGDIGSARRLEFAVLGDVVNVANRLEALTRELDASIIVSAACTEAIQRNGGASDALLEDFVDAGRQALRGREESLDIWLLARP